MDIIIYLAIILIIIIFLYLSSCKESFIHPAHPSYPWYIYNFPTRMYYPTRNMITDIRGDPRCPHFGYCGNTIRHNIGPDLIINPLIYPHLYYYDYYYPIPNFNYNLRYDIDGSLYKIKKEKINTIPSASN